jgi:hypothetical protein
MGRGRAGWVTGGVERNAGCQGQAERACREQQAGATRGSVEHGNPSF